ncbi:MAG: tRNA (adenosine(37)-N6)-threonylcarbamoyltransferase complex transferase subunit TsaD [Clostridia bacterium]|nr:tRNA (adenosine(37)-N6)-threonylcarbamoyltransferase complex transferase subunit TsaD [Clostridia bacterium]
MLILSFESSCDETSTAVLKFDDNGFVAVLSNIVASQIEIHARYGGVVPEIASRAHAEAISKITYEALEVANVTIDDIDAIAVTAEPGLIGALLVGVNFAKSLAYSQKKPLIPVNHMRGHIAANYISNPGLKPPYIAMIASGGHTSIVRVDDYRDMTVIGSTRDDAIGEAFDKVARVMGMPYPGGAALDKLAYQGKPVIKFPSAAIKDDTLDFSFSGIKTAVLNYLNIEKQKENEINEADVAASFTEAVVSSVLVKLKEAFARNKQIKKLVLAGGVAANSHLRDALNQFCMKNKLELYMPEKCYCGDNAAMIGSAAYFEYKAGNFADTSLNANAVSEI